MEWTLKTRREKTMARTLTTLNWNTLYVMYTSFQKEDTTTAAERILEYVETQVNASVDAGLGTYEQVKASFKNNCVSDNSQTGVLQNSHRTRGQAALAAKKCPESLTVILGGGDECKATYSHRCLTTKNTISSKTKMTGIPIIKRGLRVL